VGRLACGLLAARLDVAAAAYFFSLFSFFSFSFFSFFSFFCWRTDGGEEGERGVERADVGGAGSERREPGAGRGRGATADEKHREGVVGHFPAGPRS
jgi:hypothetical protein